MRRLAITACLLVIFAGCLKSKGCQEQPSKESTEDDIRTQLQTAMIQRSGRDARSWAILKFYVPVSSLDLQDAQEGGADLLPLFDMKITATGNQVSASNERFDKTYSDIVSRSEWASAPKLETDDAAALKEALDALYTDPDKRTPKETYAEYLSLKKKLEESARGELRGDQKPVVQNKQDRTRLQNLERLYKFSQHERTVARFDRENPVTREAEVRRRLKFLEFKEGRTSLAGIEQLLQKIPATQIEFTVSDADIPLRLVDAEGKNLENVPFVSDFTLSFEVLALPIQRPWYSPTFFADPAWRFSDDQGGSTVSTGAEVPDKNEMLPYVAKTALFIRRVEIRGDLNARIRKEIRTALKKRLGIRLGPLTLAGRTYGDAGEDFIYLTPETTKQAITTTWVQMVGWLVERVPRSPNPSPTLTWKK
jgi:hypothetical protein